MPLLSLSVSLQSSSLRGDVHPQEAKGNELMRAFITQGACYRHGPSEHIGPLCSLTLSFPRKWSEPTLRESLPKKCKWATCWEAIA